MHLLRIRKHIQQLKREACFQIKSNQIKSFITRRLKFIQYKYHIEKYNPRVEINTFPTYLEIINS